MVIKEGKTGQSTKRIVAAWHHKRDQQDYRVTKPKTPRQILYHRAVKSGLVLVDPTCRSYKFLQGFFKGFSTEQTMGWVVPGESTRTITKRATNHRITKITATGHPHTSSYSSGPGSSFITRPTSCVELPEPLYKTSIAPSSMHLMETELQSM